MALLFGLPPVFSGNMNINADYLLYCDSLNIRRMELFYEIPFNSLTFIKTDTGYIALYRIALEIKDQYKNTIAVEVWDRELGTTDYQQTVNRDSFASGLLKFSIPEHATGVRIFVYDLHSERQGMTQLVIEPGKSGMLLRLLKSAQPNPSRIYGINDTIEILAEIFRWFKNISNDNDSMLWLIKRGNRVVICSRTPLMDTLDNTIAFLKLPITDFGVFTTGTYTAEAKLVPGNISGQAEFRVELPFFYDDSAWEAKIDQLLYVASIDEMRKLKRTPRANREAAWFAFWRDRDPNPSTVINEQEEEYFSRISYCEKHFSRGDRGYRSDRAKVYVTYGPPDQIESRPFEIDRPAEEIWYYYQKNLRFVFVDRFGSGEFVMWRR